MSHPTVLHTITLPYAQAFLWRDVANALGMIATITYMDNGAKVNVRGKQNDIETAWLLFREEFDRLTKF